VVVAVLALVARWARTDEGTAATVSWRGTALDDAGTYPADAPHPAPAVLLRS
jgi:hypothetical protein